MKLPISRPEKTTGIARRMMKLFSVLLVVMGVGLFFSSTYIYTWTYGRISLSNLSDVADQTTNNLDASIVTLEDIHLQILASQVVQEQLRLTNKGDINGYIKRNVDLTLERELATSVLLNPNVQSAYIVSKNGDEFSITNIDGESLESVFAEEEIYEANGTTLWKLVGEENNVCTAKAILDLKTMMPLGYMTIVYKQDYFEDIVKDNSTEFSSYVYVVDQEGCIVSTNNQQYLNTEFPIVPQELSSKYLYRYDVLNDENAYFYAGEPLSNGWMLIQSVSLHDLYKNIYNSIRIAGVLLLVILILGAVVLKIATKHIAQPTRNLVESMKRFGAGNLKHRVAAVTNDELGQIGREYNRMADNIETLINQVYKMEITQKQAEIDFLSMQINPHFLYNTLDTISWMAIGEQNSEISEMTIALAELLRAMVKRDRFITVEEEMRTVKDYLYIQTQRFGDKITIKYEVDEIANPCMIPNFILQPLIENAIIHGLEPKLDKGTLWIDIFVEKENLVFCIKDDGVGMTAEEIEDLYKKCESNDTKQNIGLKNVYRRLILCYGEESRLRIESSKSGGTSIEFRLPVSFADGRI